MKKNKMILVLYAIAMTMGIVTIIFSWTGLPGNYDTEPLLGIGVFCLALAALNKIKK